jgi:tetratricopeptide (TPR) repeat protein
MMRLRLLVLLVSCAVAAACGHSGEPTSDSAAPAATAPASAWRPFDLGTHHRPVSTSSVEAQRAFDQGLIWAYAFNHDEAQRAFEEAARLDPNLAMAYWGIALVNGPHFNNPFVDEAHAKAAWEALAKAREHAEAASEVERALIDALGSRYAMPQPADRTPLDVAYAQAMGKVHERFPNDADVATLHALSEALRLQADHPGALHLWIHTFEASQQPERAADAADRLRTLVPDASHLVHMPAHIDARLGRWTAAAETNEHAIAADERYLARKPQIGFYALYMAHNVHFLGYTAMMQGREKEAIARMDEIVAGMPPEKVREAPLFMDAFLTVGLEARKRFGRWQEIVDTPLPLPEFPVATAFAHMARGVAFAAMDQLDEAEKERAAFLEALPKIPKDAYFGSNLASAVMAPAVPYLDGEIAYRKGKLDEAVRDLSRAVKLEDELKFDDPPPWTTPSRHALGAVLLEAKRPGEAEAVYRADLVRYPENGWSLSGLAKALAAQRKTDEAAKVQARFEQAWARADKPIGSSCLCVGSKAAAM